MKLTLLLAFVSLVLAQSGPFSETVTWLTKNEISPERGCVDSSLSSKASDKNAITVQDLFDSYKRALVDRFIHERNEGNGIQLGSLVHLERCQYKSDSETGFKIVFTVKRSACPRSSPHCADYGNIDKWSSYTCTGVFFPDGLVFNATECTLQKRLRFH